MARHVICLLSSIFSLADNGRLWEHKFLFELCREGAVREMAGSPR